MARFFPLGHKSSLELAANASPPEDVLHNRILLPLRIRPKFGSENGQKTINSFLLNSSCEPSELISAQSDSQVLKC